jgi:hypothetical protein
MSALDDKIQQEAVETLRDVIANYEVPKEYVPALLEAYKRGGLNILPYAKSVTLEAAAEWMREVVKSERAT